MARQERPLSPHLQVYRPQITSVLSILHRITGVALAVGSPLFIWWLYAAMSGAEDFATLSAFTGSALGLLMLIGWSFALFYHLLNGIRHLAWDLGIGLELETAAITGWSVVILSTALTIGAWYMACPARGGL